MSEGDDFDSSDASRSAAPLLQAQTWTLDQRFPLESGGVLDSVAVCYETYGRLSPNGDNAVLVCHAVSGDSHVARHDEADAPGWWEVMVGPGRPIDTSRYFVVCSNVLGGCRGTSGPNFTNPRTGKPYGSDFPVVTVGDMVRLQALLLEHLGVGCLHAVVGGSLGGFQALEWATALPHKVRGCVAVATSPRLNAQALAFDVVGRNAITQDVRFRGGQYYDGPAPEAGLAIARMLAHVTYLSSEAMQRKFDPTRFAPREVSTAFEKKFSVGSYLAYQGHKFVERFDANSYITLSMAMDLFDLGDTPEKLRAALRPSRCRWLILSFSSDWLYLPEQSRELVGALLAERKPVSYCNIESLGGHDSFLLEEGLATGGRMIAAFLGHLRGEAPEAAIEDRAREDATSIFHHRRLDYRLIAELIAGDASVLDVGCGNGELLALLRQHGNRRLMGIELDESAVADCIERGLDVVQADVDRGLSAFSTGQFDVVVLSQTLQSIEDVSGVLRELVRVGAEAIVSFPNFAHRPMREMLYRQGRVPKEPGLYAYDWHDTPNRRFPSIVDFEDLCAAKGFRILRAIYIDTAAGQPVTDDPNLNADTAIVVLGR